MNQASHTRIQQNSEFSTSITAKGLRRLLRSQRMFQSRPLSRKLASSTQRHRRLVNALNLCNPSIPQLHSSSGMINPTSQHQGVLSQAQSMMNASRVFAANPSTAFHHHPRSGSHQGIRRWRYTEVLHLHVIARIRSNAAYGGYGSQQSQIWGPPSAATFTHLCLAPHGYASYQGQMHSQQQSRLPSSPRSAAAPQAGNHTSHSHLTAKHRPSQQMQSLQMHQQIPSAGGMALLGYQGGQPEVMQCQQSSSDLCIRT